MFSVLLPSIVKELVDTPWTSLLARGDTSLYNVSLTLIVALTSLQFFSSGAIVEL